ncbi:DUF6113 family protein [Geodermatophilus sp. YIM 151500]|uniref:DUF6113 family protein n=1 Tax=Geodermatophilus sp. YIM 151500 TaxID=2984531 RepID=UPI0021E3D1BA|nr:DUF6113 family protein [Geodermatophilus sp. YIM 151500]MCV2489390.1 DUF6113 family protein [Geodermatophilus sp. YIM 151500]
MSVVRATVLLAGAVVGTAAAAWLAVVQVFWLPLRIGGVLVPVSVAAAVVGNLLLVRATHRVTGSRLVAVLPAATWLAVALTATRRRPEGDLLLVGGGALGAWGLAYLLLGALAAAVAVGGTLARRPRPADAVTAPARPVAAAGPAGSGTGGAR